MAFLDNSGDIILDAVLTDLGRQKLAKGNFRIQKFALGDEEINYALFDSSDNRGSAFYDLEIMQTPLLEAFTSDQSLMHSRLMTFERNNILYLPILKANNKIDSCRPNVSLGGWNLIADNHTYTGNNTLNQPAEFGFLHGVSGEFASTTTHICVDQGIDSAANGMSIATEIDENLLDRSFLIKMDSRLLKLESFVGEGNAQPVNDFHFDDDGIVTYRLTQGRGNASIMGPRDSIPERRRDDIDSSMDDNQLAPIAATEMFAGPLGNVLRIVPRTTQEVQLSTSLFDELGNDGIDLAFKGVNNGIDVYKFIDTTISVMGVDTGFKLDLPIRIIKGSAFGS